MAMNNNDFEDVFAQAQQVIRHLSGAYREVTGEDLDLESAIKHYPLLALGLAAGAGVLGGIWLGRRGAARQLPPPPPEKPTGAVDRIRDLYIRRKSAADRGESLSPLDYVENLLPPGMEIEDAAQTAKEWV